MDAKNTPLVGIIIAIAIAILGAFAFLMPQTDNTDDAMMGEDTMMEDKDTMMKDGAMEDDSMIAPNEGAMMEKGSYESYAPEKLAKADTGNVVLFFRASWCPTCRGLDASIKASLGAIPSDLTILDVDYDNSTALKQKYGVTTQHTLVQVDAQGNLIKKWSGSPSLTALVAQVN